jgi:S1-C subfamily serine protease
VLVLGITPELRKHYGVPDNRGVLVARVETGSPGAAAGLQAGDIITDAGGRAIEQASDLVGAVSGIAKGTSLDLRVVRDRKPLTLTAKLTSDPLVFQDFDWFREMFRRFEHEMPSASTNST